MENATRRRFLGTASTATAAWAADLSFLAQLSRAAAADTRLRPEEVVFGPETDRLLRLLRTTSRDACVPAFAQELKRGLSYRQFLTVPGP